MKFLKSFLLVLSAVLLFQTCAGAAAPDHDVPEEPEALKQIFMDLSAGTTSEEVAALAARYGLYSSYRNHSTGTYSYRIAADRDIADVGIKEKGSYVSISFYILQNDAVTEISYFNSSTMTESFWYPDSGYSVVDYNIPQIVVSSDPTEGTGKRTCMMPAASASEAADYVSTGSPDTERFGILRMIVSDNKLAYSSSGPGNFKTIAYTEDVAEKYGKNGTVITFDTDDSGLIWMQYSYYPSYYRQGISAAFYSRAYAASLKLDEGFLLCRAGSKPMQYKDAVRLIQFIHA